MRPIGHIAREGLPHPYVVVHLGNRVEFVANLVIKAHDRTGLVIEVATLITNMKVAMTSISAKSEKDSTATIKVSVEVTNTNMLEILMNKIEQSIKGIINIQRAAKSTKNTSKINKNTEKNKK